MVVPADRKYSNVRLKLLFCVIMVKYVINMPHRSNNIKKSFPFRLIVMLHKAQSTDHRSQSGAHSRGAFRNFHPVPLIVSIVSGYLDEFLEKLQTVWSGQKLGTDGLDELDWILLISLVLLEHLAVL